MRSADPDPAAAHRQAEEAGLRPVLEKDRSLEKIEREIEQLELALEDLPIAAAESETARVKLSRTAPAPFPFISHNASVKRLIRGNKRSAA